MDQHHTTVSAVADPTKNLEAREAEFAQFVYKARYLLYQQSLPKSRVEIPINKKLRSFKYGVFRMHRSFSTSVHLQFSP